MIKTKFKCTEVKMGEVSTIIKFSLSAKSGGIESGGVVMIAKTGTPEAEAYEVDAIYNFDISEEIAP